MEYVGLDKDKFNSFMKSLVDVYQEISKEKAIIYYNFFEAEKITIAELEEAKIELYRTKTTSWFPTMAEIRNIILANRKENGGKFDYLNPVPFRM